MTRSGLVIAVAALAVPALAAASSNAEVQVIFGPQVFSQPSETSVTQTVYFSLNPPAEAPFLLALASDGGNKVILNGMQVFGPAHGPRVSRFVDLQESDNILQVDMAGGPGSTLTVTIFGYRYAHASEYYTGTGMPSSWNPRLPGTPGVVVDWRRKGAVTAVEDQGGCQADWAFSAIGSIEANYQIKNKRLLSLSEQQLIDCAGAPAACDNGGSAKAGIAYAIQYGLETEEKYPYTAKAGTCHISSSDIGAYAGSFVQSAPGDEVGLQALVDEGPVSVVLNGNWFSDYTGGIADPCHGTEPPMYVSAVIVGYGHGPTGTPYWIVKNSLGRSWGESGYFRIAAGQDQCGIADYAVLPTE